MAAISSIPKVEDTPVHIFCELAGAEQGCEICKNGPAAYRWMEQHGNSVQTRDSIICRVCASMVVLVGKPV